MECFDVAGDLFVMRGDVMESLDAEIERLSIRLLDTLVASNRI